MARARLKKVADQVVVITGASSGIGLVTAKEAARRGARVVLVARNEAALVKAVADIEAAGGTATYVVGDVASPDDMERVARTAIEAYGGFDTWVNNASSAIYGRLDEVHLDDKRRLFDVAYWGVVHGCRAALPHLKQRGGAIVNIGSVASDVALPLLGAYSAAKHAVKGYTDALRIELDADGAPVSVSLVKPASIDTMFFEHARNYMTDASPKPVPPVYAPELVAETILHCAEHGTRELNVGGAGRAMALMRDASPRLMDKYLATSGIAQQRDEQGRRGDGTDNLFDFAEDGRERGGYRGHVMERSFYGVAARNPWTVLAVALGLGAAFAIDSHVRRPAAARGDDADAQRADVDEPDVHHEDAMDEIARIEAGRSAKLSDTATFPAVGRPAATSGGVEGDRVVRGDTSLTDAMIASDAAASTPRAREHTLARPTMAPLADMGGTSTEDAASASLLDASRSEAPRQNTGGADTGRGKTDEDWLTLG